MLIIYNEFIDSGRELELEDVEAFMEDHPELCADYEALELLEELREWN